MLVAPDDGIDEFAMLIRIDGTNLGDKLPPDSSVRERHLILALFKLGRVVVAVDDGDDDQGGAGQRPRSTTIGSDDSHLWPI